jgi:acyl-CoA thioesterase-1
VVSYPSPITTGGTAPLSVACTPLSGSTFAVGENNKVLCTVIDALQRSASCAFRVTVVAVPPVVSRLSVTRFVAFGDSITEGKFADGSISSSPYPLTLEVALRSRYTAQTVTVVNRGVGGERTVDGLTRLPGVLAADRPEVLLLLEGVNDISNGDPSLVQPMVDNLRQMARQGRNSGAFVMLATLLPERAGPGSPATRNGALPLLGQANDQIRSAAALEGVILVDLFTGLGGTPDPWIGSDNLQLHPTDEGYEKIAALFFDAIRLRFEVTQGTSDIRPTRLTTARDSRSRAHRE